MYSISIRERWTDFLFSFVFLIWEMTFVTLIKITFAFDSHSTFNNLHLDRKENLLIVLFLALSHFGLLRMSTFGYQGPSISNMTFSKQALLTLPSGRIVNLYTLHYQVAIISLHNLCEGKVKYFYQPLKQQNQLAGVLTADRGTIRPFTIPRPFSPVLIKCSVHKNNVF